jgi:hypothetical protein
MSQAKHLRLVRFVKVVLDILFGFLVFACVALLLFILFSPALMNQEGWMGTVRVPVRIGAGEEPEFEVTFSGPTPDPIQHASVVEAEGTLAFETLSWPLIAGANAARLLTAIGLAYIFHLLRGIVQAILDGNPFTAENGRRMRRLGYGVLLVGLLVPSIQHTVAAEILHRMPAAVPPLQAGPTFDAAILLISLLILILAHIWSYGLELERDKALTV